MPNPLCRDAEDDTKFCRFAGTCHDERQRLQNRLLLRGEDCWAWCLLRVDLAYQSNPEAPVQVVPTEVRP